jgi:hypothetical protein
MGFILRQRMGGGPVALFVHAIISAYLWFAEEGVELMVIAGVRGIGVQRLRLLERCAADARVWVVDDNSCGELEKNLRLTRKIFENSEERKKEEKTSQVENQWNYI